MAEFLTKIIPNVMSRQEMMWESVLDTLIMVFGSGAISFVFGLILGVILVVTRKGDIMENHVVYSVLDKLINVFRSIPFIIMIGMLFPLTRLIAGTAIGVKGAIVPLVFGTVPFFSRQIESALSEVDRGLIEAAQSMGSSPMEIIFRVYLKESVPSIVRGTTITMVSLIGLTAMAGAVGAGGLGDFAIRFGYQRNQPDVTYTTVIIILVMISIIQAISNIIIRKTEH